MLNLNHLRIFYHSAKHLSHTLAARDLFISQPGVSKQVKTLEDYLGFSLFGRRGTKLYLTEEGKTLFEYTKILFDAEKKIESVVEDMKILKCGALRIGLPTAFLSFISFLIDTFNKIHPNISIQVVDGSSQSIAHDLENDLAEIAIIGKVEENPYIEFVHFAREEVLFVVSPQHALALKGSVTIGDISREQIVSKASGSITRKAVLEAFRAHSMRPTILLETSNIDSIKSIVEHKSIGTFLIRPEVADEIDSGRLISIPIEGGAIFTDIYLAFLKDLKPSLPAKAFLGILEDLEPGSTYFPALVDSWPSDLHASSLFNDPER